MPRGVYPRNKMKIEATDESIENREQEVSVGDIMVNGPKSIDVAPENVLKAEKLEFERFMAEPLEVHVHEPTRDDESTHAWVGVNGDAMWLVRGGTYKLKRYHVEALANAKTGRVVQKKTVAPDGSQGYIETEVLAIAFPFTVISDPSPRGGAWLRELLRRAG